MSSNNAKQFLPPRHTFTPITPRFQGGFVHVPASTSKSSGRICESGSSGGTGTSPRGCRVGRPLTAPGSGKVGVGSGSGCVTRVKTPRGGEGGKRGDDGGGKRRTPRSRTISTLLPPRRLSSSSVVGDVREERFCGEVGACGFTPVKVESLHFGSSYSPHKSHWVRKALESLGGDWVRAGKITNSQLISEAFEEKMAVLYDLAMVKKHEAIDRLVSEEVDGKRVGVRKNKSKGSGTRGKEKEVQGNFPFSEHLSASVKSSMSDMLLRIMTRGDESPGVLKKKEAKDRGDVVPKSPKKEDTSSSSNSFDKSLRKRRGSLVQCYVIDGRLVVATKDLMMSVGGSVVNKFGESSKSRARRQQHLSGTYFRQTANMMGFLPHEVNIRFLKSSRQLIVSAARPARGSENARQVRETIEIPKGVDLSGIAVLRTCKGSLIFEEVEEVEGKR